MRKLVKRIVQSEVAKTFDPNKPYQRRDGKACEIVHTFPNGRHVVVYENSHYEVSKGGHYDNGNLDMASDLINIPEKIEGWVNVYDNFIMNYHISKENADKYASDDLIACIYVSFERGEGL